MNYRGIIFDMDGTIIDSEGIWEKATEQLIAQKGIVLDEELRKTILQKTHGLSLTPSCILLKQMLTLPDEVHELVHALSILGNQHYEKGITFIAGFPEFHAVVEKHQLKTGIATNADDRTVSITKKTLNLEKYFGKHIYNISHVNNVGKPHPAIYLHTAQQLELHPQECVVIEDSAHGIRAAKAAGMFCIGINTSKNPNQLQEADFIIDTYHEIDLPRLLKKKTKKGV